MIYILAAGFNNTSLTSQSMSHLWALGFGKVTAESLIHFSLPQGALMVFTILFANSPQVLLSALYLTCNGLLTRMLLAHEWSNFAHQRKMLRVISPKGKQRSTYRLHLPYSYGIPFLLTFGCLHWLVSQSLFLARMDVYDDDGVLNPSKSISTCAYSLIAIVFASILGLLVCTSVVLTGVRKFKPGMPLVGSCSAAISAACHPPEEDRNASQKAVMWGACERETSEWSGEAVGRCSITSFQVQAPIAGNRYAGQRRHQHLSQE